MKKLMSLLLLGFLVLAPLGGSAAESPVGPGMKRAFELFVPIACTYPEHFRWPTGTAFPVAGDMLMTAAHVDCGEGGIMEISNDGGVSWRRVMHEDRYVHSEWDVQIILVKGAGYRRPASFRPAKLGEEVFGYGVALDRIGTTGHIMASDAKRVYSSSTVIGGMSGSALVGRDGKVVGMTVAAMPGFVGGRYVSAWVTLAIPGPVLADLLKTLKASLAKKPTN